MQTCVKKAGPAAIACAARVLRCGGLVAFPTETVYGLGADGLNEEAVLRIFEAKGRPGDNPLILHVAEPDEAALYYEETPAARALAQAFWPGPLTLVLPARPIVPKAVRAGLKTVALRCPAHEVARAIIKAAGRPIAAPSANRSGKPSPTRAQDVLPGMQGRIPLIIDGGPCRVGVESTVVDLSGGLPKILRPGGVTRAMLSGVVGEVLVAGELKPGQKPASPGMKYRHYAPEAAVLPARDAEDARAIYNAHENSVILSPLAMQSGLTGCATLPWGETCEEMAANLYARLIECDRLGYDYVVVPAVDEEGIGVAVMNRLARAARRQ